MVDNAYKSFDRFDTVFVKSKCFWLKKMNFGEFVEFITNYQIMTKLEILKTIKSFLFDRKEWGNALAECYRLSVLKKPRFVSTKIARIVIDEAMKLNRPESKEIKDEKKEIDMDYFQSMIHELAYYYHWSKEDILKLYIEEIEIYFKKIAKAIEHKQKKEDLKMLDFECYLLTPHMSKDGYRDYMRTYRTKRENIINGTHKKEINIEQFRIAQDEWLKTQGVH